ncbi:hypothetical protein PRUPE_1G069100 [Prunus persica]|uniref:Uncharacterized protein n=1 Tax=Prunus persica TaxID=3760 RepID=A0A251QTM7_PRUPE|nr:hypothetical protein PRUPE_1G069100 [Prunus persica]
MQSLKDLRNSYLIGKEVPNLEHKKRKSENVKHMKHNETVKLNKRDITKHQNTSRGELNQPTNNQYIQTTSITLIQNQIQLQHP